MRQRRLQPMRLLPTQCDLDGGGETRNYTVTFEPTSTLPSFMTRA